MESIFIKKRLAAFAVLLGLGAGGVPVFAQQTDPALTAAVVAQTAELKSIHKKRRKLQERIIAAEAAVTVALDRVHSVEDKMLEYLSNAQGAMQNLYQIKRAGELVTTEIPKNCSLLTKSVGGNLKGTAIAAIVSDELTDAATQMAALYPFMKQLVTSGSYNVTGSDGKNEKHKVNLLNSSERYYIANEVVTRLEAINTVTRNFAASLFRNIKYFTLRKLYLCRKWMQKRLQKTTTTGITLPNFDFLA